MIMVALVRISGIRVAMDPKIDVQWEIFWQQMEASISVIMVSITAFRSLLGMRAAQAREKRDRAWFSYRSKLLPLNKRKTSEYDKNVDMNLPSVPGATMSGLRTYIRGSHGSSILLSKLDKSEPLPEEQQGKLSMNNVTANHPSGLSPPSVSLTDFLTYGTARLTKTWSDTSRTPSGHQELRIADSVPL